MLGLCRVQISAFLTLSQVLLARAHIAAFSKGMYCFGGVTGTDSEQNDAPAQPLWDLPKDQWWLHNSNGCPNFPPAAGDFLEIPAGGSFTVELATNRLFTTFAHGGQYASDWMDGQVYPEDYNKSPGCIGSPNMHTNNQSMAAGTAFAVSYTSDITKVTPESLVVFTVTYNTPWKRLTTYQVPAALPACPDGGCICAWGWIPNGCGEPNIYQMPYRCRVNGATSTSPVGTARPAVWCEGDAGSCVTGPKQMLYWHQQDGNNILVSGYDAAGSPKSPAYNSKCGFANGAQDDIFVQTGQETGTPSSTPATAPASPTGSNPPSGSPQNAAIRHRLPVVASVLVCSAFVLWLL